MTKVEILDFLSKNKETYLKKYHLSKLALFGSYAKGNAKEDSDIDILYELEKTHKLSLDNYLELLDELETNLHNKVDLVREKKMNPLIKLDAKNDFIYVFKRDLEHLHNI